jgi:hypothetical protein
MPYYPPPSSRAFPALYPPPPAPVNPLTEPPTASDGYDLYIRKLLAPETLLSRTMPAEGGKKEEKANPAEVLPPPASGQSQGGESGQENNQPNWVKRFGIIFGAVLTIIGGQKLWQHFAPKFASKLGS